MSGHQFFIVMWNIKKLVSKGDYFYAVVPNHPKASKKGYVLHHRVVLENKLGRLLKDNEISHHINENKKDNRPENLELMTKNEHSKHHAKLPKFVDLICPQCNKSFTRRRNQSSEVIRTKKRNFCSRVCNGKYNSINSKPKLTIDLANMLREDRKIGMTYPQLAEKYNISRSMVWHILSNKVYI